MLNSIGVTRDLLFVLLVIYFAQGTLYSSGSLISQVSLFVVLAISLLFFIRSLLTPNKKSHLYWIWTFFLFINVFSYYFNFNTLVAEHRHSYGMFKRILIVFLPFYPFLYFAQNGELKAKHFTRFLIVMIPITIMMFFYKESRMLEKRSSPDANVVNNVAYYFVVLIPLVFLFLKRKVYAMLTLLVLMFFIVQGAKRGAMLSAALGLLIYMYYLFKTINDKDKLKGYFLSFIGIVVVSYLSYSFFQDNEFLIRRLESMAGGDSSGRDRIYLDIFNTWYHSDSYSRLLFGFGFAGSTIVSSGGNFAHNDWLELLTNFGLFGVILYIVLFYYLFKYVFKKGWQIDKRLLMLTIVSLWFFSTLFSMGYTSVSNYVYTILIAYLVGSKENHLI